MKKLFVFLSIFFLTQIIGAQEVEEFIDIQVGEKQKSSTGSINTIIGKDQSGIYALKSKRRTRYLTRYSAELQEVRSTQLDLRMGDRKHYLQDLVLLGEQLWLFTSVVNKESDELELYRSVINKESLLKEGEPNLIASVKRSGNLIKNTGGFGIRFSRDEKKMAVVTHYPFAKKENERLKITTYSSESSDILWEKEIELPYREDLLLIERTRLDNAGNFYVLGKRYGDGQDGKSKDKKDGEKNYDYLVLGYFNQGTEEREYQLKLEDKFISDLQIAINDQGEMICSGFYTNSLKTGLSGAYFMRLNTESKEVIAQSLKDFDIDFITQNLSEKRQKKIKKKEAKGKDVGLMRYDLDEMVLREDGGVMLIGEQYYEEVVTYTRPTANGMTTTTTTTHYYYNDIIVVNINPKGQIEWTDKIPKRQHTTNDGGYYSSYVLGVKGDRLFFIFNDNPKNLNLSQMVKVGRYATFARQKSSIVALVVLDIEGRNTRMSMFSIRDEGMMSRPKVSSQVDDDTIILAAQKKKGEKLFRLSLKD